MKAVIPAAGLGTRFLPATKAQPKEMLAIYEKPTIHYVIEWALNSCVDDILIITGRNKRSIVDYFDKSPEIEYMLQKAGKERYLKQVRKITDLADICYVIQKNLKGLGCDTFNRNAFWWDPFTVLLGDSITQSKTSCVKELIDIFNKYQKSTISIREVPKDKTCSYGIIDSTNIEDNLYKIKDLVEKLKVNQVPSNLAITGRYVLTLDIFDKIDQTEQGFNGEVQLTDVLSKLDGLYGIKFTDKVFNMENSIGWF